MVLVAKVLAACGNDCASCPRYVAHPYEKTTEELQRTAELWMRIGYRDRIVPIDQIVCEGCRPSNWCRYHIIECCVEKGIDTCAECPSYPCATMTECFEVTESFVPACRAACTDEEFELISKAFFEKEKNLAEARVSKSKPGAVV